MSLKHQTPWKVSKQESVEAIHPCVYVDDGARRAFTLPAWCARRIVRAVNTYESPVATAERAVVRAAIKLKIDDIRARDIWNLYRAVVRLLSARAKAKKGARK
jgi:hypothetical protein